MTRRRGATAILGREVVGGTGVLECRSIGVEEYRNTGLQGYSRAELYDKRMAKSVQDSCTYFAMS